MADKPKLFCSNCGYKFSSGDKFCSSCGLTLVVGETSSNTTSNDKPKSTISFEEFRKRKEERRSSYFIPKSKTKRKTPPKANENVTISVGIMRSCDNMTLKRVRGSTMALTCGASSNQKVILELAVAKHSRFNRAFNGDLKYTLLYPDGSEVKSTLPQSNEAFSLEKYKNELGKPYSRITFYVCRVVEFLPTSLLKEYHSDQSSDDDEGQDSDNVNYARQPSATCSSTSSAPTSSLECEKAMYISPNTGISCGLATSPTLIIPSTSSSCGYSSAPTSNREMSSRQVECPTCFELFDISKIADHADNCADIWVGEVEHGECFLQDQEDELEMPVLQQSPKEVQHDSNVFDIKSILEGLAEREISGQTRINLRRTFMWNDFKEARMRKRVVPENLVKVVFLGEPAIDDGGPRREFYSGMI